jgi:hypothetical protein
MANKIVVRLSARETKMLDLYRQLAERPQKNLLRLLETTAATRAEREAREVAQRNKLN